MDHNPNRKILKKDSTVFMGALDNFRKEEKLRKTEKGKIVEWVYNLSHIWSERKPELAEQLLSPNLIVHQGPFKVKGNAMKEFSRVLHMSVDDYTFGIEDITYEGNLQDGTVVTREVHRGIFKQEIPEVPETKLLVGKDFEYYACTVWKVQRGVVQEMWSYDGASEYPYFPQIMAYFYSLMSTQ